MLKSVAKELTEFDRMIWSNENRSVVEAKPIIAQVHSAPPMFRSSPWKTIQEFNNKKPAVFPSMHLIKEASDWDYEYIYIQSLH